MSAKSLPEVSLEFASLGDLHYSFGCVFRLGAWHDPRPVIPKQRGIGNLELGTHDIFARARNVLYHYKSAPLYTSSQKHINGIRN